MNPIDVERGVHLDQSLRRGDHDAELVAAAMAAVPTSTLDGVLARIDVSSLGIRVELAPERLGWAS